MLRPYQQRALDAIIGWIRKSTEPCLIEAATGAGKSHIIAALAAWYRQAAGKRVLCLAPSAELVTQNHEKYTLSGYKASIYSASAGEKSLRHDVVFGTPITVLNNVDRISRLGFGLVVIDECHGITPTIIQIVDALRDSSGGKLRVVGMTATPYRLGDGYIFREWPDGKLNGDDVALDPFFAACVDRITALELIDQGFLARPVVGAINADRYDTGGLKMRPNGTFDPGEVDRAYHGHGRLTASIVADIVDQSRDRRGVLIFAATVKHAQEVLASLPPSLSAIVTGETNAMERRRIINDFKAMRLKYIVNVAVLTTGFDAPHVDVVAVLRKTESAALLQQIIGRGLRTYEGKADCLILDYTTNLDDHFSGGDIFEPDVKAVKASQSDLIDAVCPDCGHENRFAPRKEYAEHKRDDAGYVVDLDGNRVMGEDGPIPAHHGRRCMGYVAVARGKYERCAYRWTEKTCPECGHGNDIAARYCESCDFELIDPNQNLVTIDRARDAYNGGWVTEPVIWMQAKEGTSRSGNAMWVVDYTTPTRTIRAWYVMHSNIPSIRAKTEAFELATNCGNELPAAIRYKKEPGEKFWDVEVVAHQNADGMEVIEQ